jgi:hypothetical protein
MHGVAARVTATETANAQPEEVEARAPSGSRRYAKAFAVGALLAGVVFFWMVTEGTFDPGHRVPFSANFYDVQAHRFLEGHLSMPASVLNIEGYEHNGNTYMYFGPVPALLRLPVAVVTDSLDGHTGVVTMTLAYVLAMVALGRISWRLRRWARGGREVDTTDAVLAGVTAFVLGAGSSIMFLGAGDYVYHEAILWGVAFGFAAFEAILAWIERPRGSVLLLAGVLATLALLSRVGVGIGPPIALGLLAVAVALVRIWPRAKRVTAGLGLVTEQLGWNVVAGLVAACLAPVALYALVNEAKFGTLFSIPFDHQAVNAIVPQRAAVLAANGGTLQNVRALPTNLLQYLRPDAVQLDAAWPWVRLPSWRPSVIGDVRYDLLDHTSSVTAAMPLFVVLGLGGLVAMVRAGARTTVATARSVTLPFVGALCAAVPSLTIVYIAERYTGDFLPLLVLPALVGLHAFVRWSRSSSARRGLVVGASIALGVLALWGCVANVGIARDYQLRREQVTTFNGN